MSEPWVKERRIGGWIAVSPKREPIKIGVIAATRDEAVSKYLEALTSWREMTADFVASPRIELAPLPQTIRALRWVRVGTEEYEAVGYNGLYCVSRLEDGRVAWRKGKRKWQCALSFRDAKRAAQADDDAQRRDDSAPEQNKPPVELGANVVKDEKK